MVTTDETAGMGDLAPDELRRVGADVVEAIAEYHAGLAGRAVQPDVTPAEVAALFAGGLPVEGEPAAALIQDWRDRVAPLLTAVGSPRQFAYVLGSGATVGIFADALAACSNSSGGAWRMGPAATEIERQCLRWIAGFIGYPQDAGGLMVSGGTMANFTAILTALRHTAPYNSTPEGLQDRARSGRFLLYMSDHEGHVSVTRAADMLNLGRNAVRLVPSRPDFTIDPIALDRMLAEDRERGDLPFVRGRAARIGQRGSDRPDRRAGRRLRPARRLAARRRSLRAAGGGPRGEARALQRPGAGRLAFVSTRTSGSAFPTTAASCWSAPPAAAPRVRDRSAVPGGERRLRGRARLPRPRAADVARLPRPQGLDGPAVARAPAGCGKGSRGASASPANCTGS